MDLFSTHQGYYSQVYETTYGPPHHSFGHELLGGAAAFAVFKLYERRQAQNGQPIAHAGAKAALASLIGFEVVRLFEGNRYRHLDQEMVRRHAEQQCYAMYDQRYGGVGYNGMGPGYNSMGPGYNSMGPGYNGGYNPGYNNYNGYNRMGMGMGAGMGLGMGAGMGMGGFGPSVGFTETESISMGGGFGGPFGLGGGIRETETISVDRGFGGPFGFGGGIVEQETISMGGGLGFGGIGISETESVSFGAGAGFGPGFGRW